MNIRSDSLDPSTPHVHRHRLKVSPPIKYADGVPGFKVFVLGTKGSGKTVFLAALYKKLCVQDKRGNSFLLRCENASQRGELLEKLDQMQLEHKWPPPNYEVDRFQFLCCHEFGGTEVPLFRFEYVDYPGGFIVRPPPEFSAQKQVQTAHSVLVLLDGQKIYDLFESKEQNARGIYVELDKLLSVLVDCIGRPVHFLITKSDIFDFRVHSLERIADALLEHRNFRNMVERLCEAGPVHLVPVSAVGPTFAAYENGRMTRRPGGHIEPQAVDLSIGFTLIDYIRQLKLIGDSNLVGREYPLLWLVQRCRWMLSGVPGFRKSVETMNKSETLRWFTLWLPINLSKVLDELESVAKTADSKLENISLDLENRIRRMTDSVHDRSSALAAVVQIQAALVAAFERRFPESNLNARIADLNR